MPLPKPHENETEDEFVGRCMADTVMRSEYPDEGQRRAVCGTQWSDFTVAREVKSLMEKEYGKNQQNVDREYATFAKRGNELVKDIFAVGRWNGMEFDREDLQMMAAAFNALQDVHHVPLKMGHNDEQPFTDGQPALGWVSEVFVEGDKLMARFTDMPDVVFNAMNANLYRHVSIEFDVGVKYKGQYYPFVLSGVALLGADIPAVNTLDDLNAFMGRDKVLPRKERKAFTADLGNTLNMRKDDMAGEGKDGQTIDNLNATIQAQKTEITKLHEDKVQMSSEIERLKSELKGLKDVEEHRKEHERRNNLFSKLEKMVTDKKITPANRESYQKEYDDAGSQEARERVVYAVEQLEKTIDSNPEYFGAEQARKDAERRRNEADKNPSAIVNQRTNEYMVNHGEKNYAVAKTAVLRADPELAERYTKGGAA